MDDVFIQKHFNDIHIGFQILKNDSFSFPSKISGLKVFPTIYLEQKVCICISKQNGQPTFYYAKYPF